ncbi:hypothetical protein QTG54_012329 [Skeletonema marinoi]|uniref:Uncharacterized protein n=1 Tax=Skeletonema marinoi TaxID=267567 RepID=A0AAD8XZN0_9STRA|nr:hypothetical protein QTG54_012329 [Skeletonema marinoi]
MADGQQHQQFQQQQQQLEQIFVELDRSVHSGNVKCTIECIIAIVKQHGLGPEWIQDNIYSGNERGNKVNKLLNNYTAGATDSKRVIFAEIVNIAINAFDLPDVNAFTGAYQKGNEERVKAHDGLQSAKRGAWYWLGLDFSMDDDVKNGIKLLKQRENEKQQQNAGQASAFGNFKAAASGNTNAFAESSFQGQGHPSSSNASFGSKENFPNLFPSQRSVRSQSSAGSMFGFGGKGAVQVQSTPSRLGRSSKKAQKQQVAQMLSTPHRPGAGFDLEARFSGLDFGDDASSITGTGLNFDTEANLLNSQQILRRNVILETFADWTNEMAQFDATVSDAQQRGNGNVQQRLNGLLQHNGLLRFRADVNEQASLRDNHVTELKNRIANIQGCLDGDTRRKVRDGLVGERKDKKAEELRQLLLDAEKEKAEFVTRVDAKVQRKIGEINARYDNEDAEQGLKENATMRIWESQLEDYQTELADVEEEKIRSLTKAKAQLYIIDAAYKTLNIQFRSSAWNETTGLADLELNGQAKQQFQQEYEKLAYVRHLHEIGEWDELSKIVWEEK